VVRLCRARDILAISSLPEMGNQYLGQILIY